MRIRFRFSKRGKVRWTSHRDVARMWERALRRVQVPVAWSSGFSPRPRLSFGLALPTGAESDAEFLDVELSQPAGEEDVAVMVSRLGPALPIGVDVSAGAPVGDRAPSLQHDVTSCSWDIEVAAGGDLSAAVDRVLSAERLVVTRQRKGQDVTDDIRPAILDLRVVGDEWPARLECELATQPRGLRPSELLAGLGVEPIGARLTRTHQWIQRDGARREPLAAGATDAPCAQERAS